MQTVASGRILAGNAGAEAAAEKCLGAAVRLRGARELRNREVSGWERKAGSERRWEQSYWHWSEAEARWSAAGAEVARNGGGDDAAERAQGGGDVVCGGERKKIK